MKRIVLLILSVICISLSLPWPVQGANNTAGVKELNFVFLHGYNGHSCTLQLLEDSITDKLTAHIRNYEADHPGVSIQADTLKRCYPNDVDIDTWANNIAEAINEHFADKENLVLIGHSMGGKTALYAVAHNIGNLADKVAMVVTINSPIKSLSDSYYIGGDTALDFWGAQLIMPDQGVLESLINYDSSRDGKWVSENKHWLAFISAESSPLSSQFDVSSIDALPRVMDDTIVPISFQYAEGADVVYYGEYGHGDFGELKEVSDYLADQILRYIFGGKIECSVFARGGSFEHKADLFPGTDYREDTVGGVLASSGNLTHTNDSWFQWQEWEDIVGDSLPNNIRSNYQITQNNSFALMTGIQLSGWADANNLEDGRVYLVTRAAPRSSVQAEWRIYHKGLLPDGIVRDHYEVEVESGTQFSGVEQVAWETDDPRDVRLRIQSQAQSPFRWFKADWRVYAKESRQMKIIDEMPARMAK